MINYTKHIAISEGNRPWRTSHSHIIPYRPLLPRLPQNRVKFDASHPRQQCLGHIRCIRHRPPERACGTKHMFLSCRHAPKQHALTYVDILLTLEASQRNAHPSKSENPADEMRNECNECRIAAQSRQRNHTQPRRMRGHFYELARALRGTPSSRKTKHSSRVALCFVDVKECIDVSV